MKLSFVKDLEVPVGRRINIGYLRVSTDMQVGSDRVSLEQQMQYVVSAAATNGAQIDRWFMEVESASTLMRGELQAVRDLVAADVVDTVYVYRLDRLSRTAEEGLHLETEFRKVGVRIVSATEQFQEGPLGNIFRGFIYLLAEYERQLIKSRLYSGRAFKVKTRGTHPGSRVYGYKNLGEGAMELDPQQAAAIRRAFILKTEGKVIREIADALNSEGFLTARGKPFQAAQVHRILARKSFYLGKAVLGGAFETDVIPAHQAIIQEAS